MKKVCLPVRKFTNEDICRIFSVPLYSVVPLLPVMLSNPYHIAKFRRHPKRRSKAR